MPEYKTKNYYGWVQSLSWDTKNPAAVEYQIRNILKALYHNIDPKNEDGSWLTPAAVKVKVQTEMDAVYDPERSDDAQDFRWFQLYQINQVAKTQALLIKESIKQLTRYGHTNFFHETVIAAAAPNYASTPDTDSFGDGGILHDHTPWSGTPGVPGEGPEIVEAASEAIDEWEDGSVDADGESV